MAAQLHVMRRKEALSLEPRAGSTLRTVKDLMEEMRGGGQRVRWNQREDTHRISWVAHGSFLEIHFCLYMFVWGLAASARYV